MKLSPCRRSKQQVAYESCVNTEPQKTSARHARSKPHPLSGRTGSDWMHFKQEVRSFGWSWSFSRQSHQLASSRLASSEHLVSSEQSLDEFTFLEMTTTLHATHPEEIKRRLWEETPADGESGKHHEPRGGEGLVVVKTTRLRRH